MNDFNSNNGFQTTFGFGNTHFSEDHSKHRFGSTSPIQHDFGLNMPNGRFKPLVGMDAPQSDLPYQTTLNQFKSIWRDK